MEKIKVLSEGRISREDAAKLLNVSLKAIDRYSKPGKTKPAKLKTKQTSQRESGGFITHFDRVEVEALAAQMKSGAETDGHSATGTQALTRRSEKLLEKKQRDTTAVSHLDISERLSELPMLSLRHSLSITEKAGISIVEAIELSGMSRAALMRGVNAKQIKHDHNGPKGSLRLSTKDVIEYASGFMDS